METNITFLCEGQTYIFDDTKTNKHEVERTAYNQCSSNDSNNNSDVKNNIEVANDKMENDEEPN